MNIQDAEFNGVEGDRLEAIFNKQRVLAEKYKEIEGMPDFPMNPHTKEGQRFFKDFAWRMTEEIAEALEARDLYEEVVEQDEETAFRHQLHMDEEMADALHFLVENLIIIGITPEDIVPMEGLPEGIDRLSYLYGMSKSALMSVETIQNYGVTIDEMVVDVIKELGKAMNCLKNKPWKQTQILTDIPKFRSYMINTFTLFITLLFVSGIDDDYITELYFKKSQVNEFRQRSKY